jgi:predicted lipoprotein with Yx(FWY)xxD motif
MRHRAVALLFAAVLVTTSAACNDDDDNGDDTTTTTEPAPEPPGDTAPGDDAEAQGTVEVTTSPDAELGEILVDGNGFVLYVFLDDTPGSSTCVDACASAWPPVPGDQIEGDLGDDAASLGTIRRPDGSAQASIGDRPLYYFSGDTAPGETNGQGLNNVWYVVGPDGEPIEDAVGS